MAKPTQQERLDAFCRRHGFYDGMALLNETQTEFRNRKEREWSKRESDEQLRVERTIANNIIINQDLAE